MSRQVSSGKIFELSASPTQVRSTNPNRTRHELNNKRHQSREAIQRLQEIQGTLYFSTPYKIDLQNKPLAFDNIFFLAVHLVLSSTIVLSHIKTLHNPGANKESLSFSRFPSYPKFSQANHSISSKPAKASTDRIEWSQHRHADLSAQWDGGASPQNLLKTIVTTLHLRM